jgi:hypothetical protein
VGLTKGPVEGNVITVYRPKTPWERMTYSDLLGERRFLRGELKRIRKAVLAVEKIDPRGMWWPETTKLLAELAEFEQGCNFVIKELQKEMINRGVGAPERPFT